MIISEKPVELKLDNYLWGSRRENVSASAVVFHTGTVLHVNFSVSESELRRMVNEPNGMVWTDSCVEIFIKAEDSDEYTNIECSASGAFLACHGPGRKDRIRYSAEERSAVSTDVAILENNNKRSLKRHSSLFRKNLSLLQSHRLQNRHRRLQDRVQGQPLLLHRLQNLQHHLGLLHRKQHLLARHFLQGQLAEHQLLRVQKPVLALHHLVRAAALMHQDHHCHHHQAVQAVRSQEALLEAVISVTPEAEGELPE